MPNLPVWPHWGWWWLMLAPVVQPWGTHWGRVGAQRRAGDRAGCPGATFCSHGQERVPWAAESSWPGPRPGRGSVLVMPWGWGSACCLGLFAPFARQHPGGAGLLRNGSQSQRSPNGCGALKALPGPKCSHRARKGPGLRVPHSAAWTEPTGSSCQAAGWSWALPGARGGRGWGLATPLQNPQNPPRWAACGPDTSRAAPPDTMPRGLCMGGPSGHSGVWPPEGAGARLRTRTPLCRPAFGGVPMAGAKGSLWWVFGAPLGSSCPSPTCRCGWVPSSPADVSYQSHRGWEGPSVLPSRHGCCAQHGTRDPTVALGLTPHGNIGQLWGTAPLSSLHISPAPAAPQPHSLSPPSSHGLLLPAELV